MNKHRSIVRLLALTLILQTAAVANFGQGRPAAKGVSETNVRAQMNFLAGDAMQGRGSGTLFERIAAEYVGSQFMQFGLEPDGDRDASGKASYVQTVNMTRNSFKGAPAVKYGNVTHEHGKDIVVMRTTTGSVTGGLKKLKAGGTATAGSAVFLPHIAADDQQKVMQRVSGLMEAGASIILVEETLEMRANWDAMAARKVTFAADGKPVVLIGIATAAAAALAAMPDGTQITFGGELAPAQTRQTWNAIGKIPGTGKAAAEIILLTSHLDHLGVRDNAPGDDKIYNGADDDASGTVAVLELARVLASGKRPRRTVYFVCFGSEELGGHGAGYFVKNLPFPKEKLVANLEFEMIGRPDGKVKADELWLTGYDRSDLGPQLAKRGARLVADPHPEENFFQRSDNYTLARQGIIAHTVSSFGLHKDYHQASDEIDTINFVHMTRSIASMAAPVTWLINSPFVPTWNEGKRP